jgi:hypothetical protein
VVVIVTWIIGVVFWRAARLGQCADLLLHGDLVGEPGSDVHGRRGSPAGVERGERGQAGLLVPQPAGVGLVGVTHRGCPLSFPLPGC